MNVFGSGCFWEKNKGLCRLEVFFFLGGAYEGFLKVGRKERYSKVDFGSRRWRFLEVEDKGLWNMKFSRG